MRVEPIISVIVPVYRAEAYIRRCLDSLVAQTFDNFEVILVDDGSPDKCGEICDEYAARDNRFRVIHQNNCGVSVARQTGIDNAHGEYTIHVDPDDWVEHDMLTSLYEKAKKTNADMVVCDFWVNKKYCSQFFYPETAAVLTEGLLQHLHGSCWNKLVRRSCYIKPNIRFSPAHICIAEDLLFNLRILHQNITVCHLPKAFYHYNHRSANSLTKSVSMKYIQSYMDMVAEVEKSGIFDKTIDKGFGLKKYLIFEVLKSKRFSMLQTLYPEIHDVIKREVHKYNIFSPVAGCLAIALNGKPRLALWIYRVNMFFINTKEYFQHHFRRQV